MAIAGPEPKGRIPATLVYFTVGAEYCTLVSISTVPRPASQERWALTLPETSREIMRAALALAGSTTALAQIIEGETGRPCSKQAVARWTQERKWNLPTVDVLGAVLRAFPSLSFDVVTRWTALG